VLHPSLHLLNTTLLVGIWENCGFWSPFGISKSRLFKNEGRFAILQNNLQAAVLTVVPWAAST